MVYLFSSGNVALSVLMTAASTLSAVVSELIFLTYPMLSSFKSFLGWYYVNVDVDPITGINLLFYNFLNIKVTNTSLL